MIMTIEFLKEVVKFLEKDLGEYGQGVAPGAYVT